MSPNKFLGKGDWPWESKKIQLNPERSCLVTSHHALNPIIKAEKILPKIFLDLTHQFHFGQHILVSKKSFKAQFLRNY